MKTKPTFVKYQEIPHLMADLNILDSDNLQVFEKIDGGNSQVRVFQGNILTGSRANFLTREENLRFKWLKDFNRWAKSNSTFHSLPENLIVYGEFTGPHTIAYRPEFTNRFFLIDVYDTQEKKFVPYVQARKRLEDLDIRDVLFLNPLTEGKPTLEELKGLAMSESQYSVYGREGVVVKDYHAQRFAKLWRTSANPTKEGLMEEIKKTILSLRISGLYPGDQTTSYSSLEKCDYTSLPEPLLYLTLQVYGELKRSGRDDISLAEIGKTVRKVTNKI